MQITIQNLTFAYEGSYENIFENVSLTIDTSWKLGLIGRNGRGKTTLLRLLQQKMEYSGTISCPVDLEYFPYPVSDPYENALDAAQEICPDFAYWQLVRELNLLEVPEDVLYQPFYTLSNGERTKLMLAALFLNENDFLLIDEPTNHLDLRGRELVSRYLAGKKGFILVSHDRSFLDGCIDHVMAINRTDIEIQQGNFSTWYENQQRQMQFELAENRKLEGEIGRLKKSAAERAAWSSKAEKGKFGTTSSGSRVDRGYVGHKAAKSMKRSKAIENRRLQAARQKEFLLKNAETVQDLSIRQLPYKTEKMADFSNVSVYYDDRMICGPVSFSVMRGDRIALVGKNGSGKSSLLKLLCGEDIPHTGTFTRGSGLRISYVQQNAVFEQTDLSDYAEAAQIDESLFKAILRKLDFSREQFDTPLQAMSEGQKKKVQIARSLCEQAHLLVWDEPLNYIDVLSRMQIEKLLLDYRPTLIFAEHDRKFCEEIAVKTVTLG
ncbi:MAG: ribosomal protection-like ABC-F family protein [Lachnospiraceae bacterium]